MTTFAVWAPIPPEGIAANLGQPEYSYGFVLARFRPLLEKLGRVVAVRHPEEADAIYDECRRIGDTCWFLVFAPPHRAPTGLRCPTTTVFAWEFETIPDEAWDGEPRNDWRSVLADHGRAIVLSQHTATAVRRAMGPDFPVAAIPAPVYDRFTLPPLRQEPPLGQRRFSVAGTVVDNQEFSFTDDGLSSPQLGDQLSHGAWDGTRIDLDMNAQAEGPARLVGFYHPEPWGTWSRVAAPAVLLPVTVTGPVEVDLVAHGLGANAGRTIRATLGDDEVSFRLPRRRGHIRLRFDSREPATVLQFHGIRADVPPGLDERTMGMGLARLTIRRPTPVPPRVTAATRRLTGRDAASDPGLPGRTVPINVAGVLFTSVLNPVDHRKNWPDLVSAFCWAFRDEPRATLLLKMTHRSVAAYASDLQDLLHRIGETRCRVLVVHGYLPDAEYEALMEATTFYANASSAEGLCMPLMEFMSAGIPAVATDNTAMADYLTPAAAFVVRSSPGYTHWPHDDRRMIRATENRVDWQSLVDAFRRSFAVALEEPAVYADMAAAARATMVAVSGDPAVAALLRDFLHLPDEALGHRAEPK